MKYQESFELPEHLQKLYQKACKLEWITLCYLMSVVVVMYLALGSSQAMKVAWIEDVLSLIPSASFLIANKINNKKRNSRFPYGYHRVFSIAFMTGAFSLLLIGGFLFIDSGMALIERHHPVIGSIQIAGHQVWMGWLMITALLYSSLPAVYLGYKQFPLAKQLHNKILYTNSELLKADYLTAFSAIIGILGIGFGIWWLDAAAALFISLSVIKDGFVQFKTAILDLMDTHPVHTYDRNKDELVKETEKFVNSWNWVREGKVRFREHGQVYFGEIFVVPESSAEVVDEIEKSYKKLEEFHWKLYDIVITPVAELPEKEGNNGKLSE